MNYTKSPSYPPFLLWLVFILIFRVEYHYFGKQFMIGHLYEMLSYYP